MRLLGLGEGLEPVGDLVQTLVAGGPRHTRVHVGVLEGLAGDRRLKVVGGSAYRLARHRVTDLGEEVEMAVRMPGLAHGGRPEHGGDVVVAFDVGLRAK